MWLTPGSGILFRWMPGMEVMAEHGGQECHMLGLSTSQGCNPPILLGIPAVDLQGFGRCGGGISKT